MQNTSLHFTGARHSTIKRSLTSLRHERLERTELFYSQAITGNDGEYSESARNCARLGANSREKLTLDDVTVRELASYVL